ncbi:AbfB domain-containing protein [Cryptosporangium aurantiacum]|uniref:Alpha-L-arabinofuranosidase B (ABFB) domain-containing protein n=1 Tax=Cryptosporangium aurantiacum TaxID=134849 RepID=A0A1M7RM26_9ACTN|nr:AbfB domain-containing protein [Cryptosporangium aurantiacum]SHN47176.1 Alpha-L-arabinofuranosidase B (ABFB) domain-containing protein [Cryptosporangium aurantiacum]
MVQAAQDGDVRAMRTLVTAHLPLLYTLVVRAASPTVDVGNVLGHTVTLVASGMPGLAEPDSFRPWLLGTAMRFLWAAEEAGNPRDTGRPAVQVDPHDQREEANAAVQWLVADDRALLSFWWLEASGELNRAEMIAACGLTPAQAETRLRQVEAHFNDARTTIRTLSAAPPCPELADLLRHWDGRPSDRQRRQITRHATNCSTCSARADDLIPADRLMRGSPLLAPPPALVEELLARCDRTPEPAGGSWGAALIDRARRAAEIPWVATAARFIAVTGAVVLTISTLLAYADSRKTQPEPTSTRIGPAAPSASPSPARATSAATTPSASSSPRAPSSSTAVASPASAPLSLSGSRSLRSVAHPDRYVRAVDDLAAVTPVSRSSSGASRREATFTVVRGLSDPSCRSFRDASGRYLRHFAFRVRLDHDDRSEIFRQDVTFCARTGATRRSVSFQSTNYPDRYLHLRGDELWIDRPDSSPAFRAAASFEVSAPLA